MENRRYSSLSVVLQQGIELLRQRLDVEDMERKALHEVLSRRQAGKFVGPEAMDNRLTRMIADKRRVHRVAHMECTPRGIAE